MGFSYAAGSTASVPKLDTVVLVRCKTLEPGSPVPDSSCIAMIAPPSSGVAAGGCLRWRLQPQQCAVYSRPWPRHTLSVSWLHTRARVCSGSAVTGLWTSSVPQPWSTQFSQCKSNDRVSFWVCLHVVRAMERSSEERQDRKAPSLMEPLSILCLVVSGLPAAGNWLKS